MIALEDRLTKEKNHEIERLTRENQQIQDKLTKEKN